MRSRALLLFTALLSAGSGLTPALAQVTQQPAPVTAHPHAAFIAEASQRFGIPEHWIRAVLRVESAGDVRAISSAGAMKVVLDAVVGAHPEPERLYELWQQALPDITEGLTASDARYTPAQREGWKDVLRHYSEYFRVLHDRAREQDDE